MADNSTASHWDGAYAAGETAGNWFQQRPEMSLRMFDTAGVLSEHSVIDVGGGASPLAGTLLDRGFADITVLDFSAAGMAYAQQRLGGRADRVEWLAEDVRAWEPWRRYRVWHDRAVFHFLTTAEDRRQYLRAMDAATEVDGFAVFGCFAPDGPRHCSGLPVARYSSLDLADQLGTQWTLIGHAREEHVTPAGVVQPFCWTVLRKHA
ncbi:MAG TPA: class I SAM-dependent methyltransferase [Streptosporangiaceae bacterium]|nr:class I SAM-dependent methyltransferase [Streptosporangiaceae bacterium]